MTQIKNQSVRNAENVENTNRIPTFEEVYAMPYIRESIESILDQSVRQYKLLAGYKDDLRQEIIIHLNAELPKFNPSKASIQTFARLAILSGLRMARRNYFTRDNVTFAFASDIDDFENYDEEDNAGNLNEEDCRAYASLAKNDVDNFMTQKDIDALLRELPEHLQDVAKRILGGDSVLEIAKSMNIPNTSFRRRYLRPIKKHFGKKM